MRKRQRYVVDRYTDSLRVIVLITPFCFPSAEDTTVHRGTGDSAGCYFIYIVGLTYYWIAYVLSAQ